MPDPATIITVVLAGRGWMLKRSVGRYFHRVVGGDFEWKPGLPVAADPDQIARLFGQEDNHQRFALLRSNPAYLRLLGKA
jgi:hypothetical protein